MTFLERGKEEKNFSQRSQRRGTEVTERAGDVLCVLCVERFDNAADETLRDLCVKHFSF
jgi:hypothetical protein